MFLWNHPIPANPLLVTNAKMNWFGRSQAICIINNIGNIIRQNSQLINWIMGTSLKIYLWRFSPQEFIEIFNNNSHKKKEITSCRNKIIQHQKTRWVTCRSTLFAVTINSKYCLEGNFPRMHTANVF